MEGTFGQLVRMGVEVALNRFMDMAADPRADVTRARDTYVNLGRGEFHLGRSLDALMAAYRVGARLAWRRFAEAGTAAELPPEALYSLGEAMFAYIDEISAESADGYAEEQSAAAGETSAGGGGRAAAGAGSRRPRRRRSGPWRRRRLGAATRGSRPWWRPPADHPPRAPRRAAPAGRRRARARRGDRRGHRRAAGAPARRRGRSASAAGGFACVFILDPDAFGRRRQIVAAIADDERGADRARARGAGGSPRGEDPRRGTTKAARGGCGGRRRRASRASVATPPIRPMARSGSELAARPPHSGWPPWRRRGGPLVVAEDHLATLLLASDRGPRR